MKKVFSLILALALILGLFPQIPLQTEAAADNVMMLRYDDHVDMTGKLVQIMDAGQGPVIALDGNHLVATGIGTAQVRIDGTAYTVTVEKAKLNLIMIMGQSNAGNHFENATSDVTCPAGTAYWWGNGLGTAAAEPVSYTQPSMGFHTPLLAELYAQSVAAGDPVKNVMIWHEGITSKDGQSIVKWASTATDTSGTDDAVTMLKNCRTYYQKRSDQYEIVSSGVYWLQGESDLTMDPTRYTQLFMAMWQQLKTAGMEYLAFFRVRGVTKANDPIRDDLFYSTSLSAQIKMINDNPEFYMATTLTENWIGASDDQHTVDISKYITVMQTYGKQASYSDQYGNTATYADGKLTTTMKALYGSNFLCHYGKFGYGLIGADAAYNMYRAFHSKQVAFVVTDTSGYASRAQVLTAGQSMTLDIADMTDHLSFRADCGSTGGTLRIIVRNGVTDITNRSGVVVSIGEKYGSINPFVLRGYPNASIVLIYTTTDGTVHTSICNLRNGSMEPKKDYVWDFNEDLNARSPDGEIMNSFLGDALAGSYTIENGYLTANRLQLALENTIELHATRDWSIEWKYGALGDGTAGFLLCANKGNTLENKALWHTVHGNLAIANYLDNKGYRNYTCDDITLKDYDQVKLANSYDPITDNSIVSLWINDTLMVADYGRKGSLNSYTDDRDMTDYPLIADFAFRYLGNSGSKDWYVNCQLDYLKISFGETQPVEETYYLFGFINGHNYACEEDYRNMGDYAFTNGKLTVTFTQDSYVAVKAEGNSKWYMTDGWMGTDLTCVTLYDTGLLFTPDKLYVPGGVPVTFTLVENADGTLTLSYSTGSVTPSTVPTISMKYPSLSFEDVISMNVYYSATDLQDVVEMGLITNTAKPAVVSIENADVVIPGYGVEGNLYFSSTAGIAPKDMGDTIYFAVYAKLKDGTYTYTPMIGYSPKTYALNQLRTGSAQMHPLVAAMLGYGAAAQTYFNYKTDALVNATMTDEQKAMTEPYRADMIASVTQASGSKLGTFISDKTYGKRYPTISFEGAFCINYYFQPTLEVVGDVTMYIWSLEDYGAAEVLTKENATKAVKMELAENGEYLAAVDGIAAKDLDKAAYVSFIYNDGTTEHCGGVIAYTIGMYCKSQAAGTGSLAELAKACAVYGYYAKQLFNK